MKHWVFDLDGTIIDSTGHYERAIEKIFQFFQMPFGPDVLSVSRKNFLPRKFFEHYLKPHQADEAMDMLIRLNSEEITEIDVFSGMPELLENLSEKVELSIWTGRDMETSKMLLEYHDLTKLLDRFVTRDCVPRTKPHPDGLEKILAEAKHVGDEVIMVGDHEYDIIGARKAGVRAISVDWHGGDPFGVSQISDKHFTRVEDLATWALGHY